MSVNEQEVNIFKVGDQVVHYKEGAQITFEYIEGERLQVVTAIQ